MSELQIAWLELITVGGGAWHNISFGRSHHQYYRRKAK